MSHSTLADCPHERRPGTTVCLHCRHEERMIARTKRQKVYGRIGLVIASGVVVAILGVAGTTAFRGTRAASVSPTPQPSSPPRVAVTPVSSAGAVAQQAAPRIESAPAPLAPVIAEGRNELRDSIFALRSGDNVEVHFDRPMARTRRADKFERLVRATLPQVYGANADSILGRIREGEIASAGDLLNELPERGLHWPVGNGMTMSLYPVTRPGQDGPLVVTYRVSVANAP